MVVVFGADPFHSVVKLGRKYVALVMWCGEETEIACTIIHSINSVNQEIELKVSHFCLVVFKVFFAYVFCHKCKFMLGMVDEGLVVKRER